MYDRIVVPIDGSECSGRALDEAIDVAMGTHARLLVLHIAECPMPYAGLDGAYLDPTLLMPPIKEAANQLLSQAVARVQAAGVTVESQLVESYAGRTVDRILDAVRKFGADLVIVGSHGRSGVSRFLLGSVSDGLIRTSPVPVLVVRGEGMLASHERPEPRQEPTCSK
jgi:nucleotide-binding universal stress UspA family protein